MDDVELRFRRLNRYAIALMELCREGEASLGYAMWLGSQIQVTEPMDTQPYLQGIIIPLTMERQEDY
jgi:hypothetical protein